MIKCSRCGKFISFDDIMESKATVDFTPDSHFGPEVVAYICKSCTEKESKNERK